MRYITREELIEKISVLKAAAEAANQNSYNAAYEYGYANALQDVLDSWVNLYHSTKYEHAVEDAKNHLRDKIKDDSKYDDIVLSGIPQIVASRFLNHYDCNIDENSQYMAIIDMVLEEMGWQNV